MLIGAALVKRTEDNLIEPINDAVFYFLNFVGMVTVYLNPEKIPLTGLNPFQHLVGEVSNLAGPSSVKTYYNVSLVKTRLRTSRRFPRP